MQVTNIQFHNVQQGTELWHALRDAVDFTASEVSAALGCSPYKTRDQLMHEKATGIKPEISGYQEKIFADGHRFEEMARPILEGKLGEELYPATITGECEGLTLLASLDGLTMDGDVAFEHKSPNSKLIAKIAEQSLDTHYVVQMEQQLILSGAALCKFIASDGTEQNWHEMDYRPDAAVQSWMISGLKQFKSDLAEYKQKLASGEITQESKPVVTAEVIQDLPAVTYKMNGLAIISNLDEYKVKALELVEQSKKKLETDQDFANAENMVKVFKSAEDKLGLMSQQVLGEVESIDSFVKDLGFISENIRQARLALDKQVKSRKEEIKTELVLSAKNEVQQLINEASTKYNAPFNVKFDFAAAIKGKRNIESMQSAINDELAKAKVALSELKDGVQANLDTINQHGEHRFLFNDWAQIAFKAPEDFATLVKLRIAEHKDAEEKRLQAERERIRKEEEAKAQAEAEQKAEALRKEKEAEDRQKAQAIAQQQAKESAVDKAMTKVPQAPSENRLEAARQVLAQAESAEVKPFKSTMSILLDEKANPEATITITTGEYDELVRKSDLLDALFATGVDNWDGYSEAMEMLKAS
ncbi:YqaJ viral recombinase family protein [Vibrio metschnikovii]|nr:YqaJ viral recombinase family protein [Vibrio metschnikovii]EKO3689019.1 YqaJ viral recombinase family protein [Vibrio metschnikovii]EKO3781119.1 YqaJ viral recombinase family protein [Vibrio metschnikovii]EKO3888105.1 YqaJ viral recombinase family protein [Vibrio metschnikovii]EKO3936721.1 YqaJ viral recombinase family protein [Vibrio metschnikovii]